MTVFMRALIRKIGNSRGIIIPKPMLAQIGLGDETDISVEDGSIVLRKPRKKARDGWTAAGRDLANSGDDALVWPEFHNQGDEELVW